jgi:hypothetical protein
MKKFLSRVAARAQRFMYGRYGSDELTISLMGAALLFFLLSGFRALWFLYFAGMLLLVLSTVRSLSRNLAARRRERERYLRLIAKPKSFFKLQKNSIWLFHTILFLQLSQSVFGLKTLEQDYFLESHGEEDLLLIMKVELDFWDTRIEDHIHLCLITIQ